MNKIRNKLKINTRYDKSAVNIFKGCEQSPDYKFGMGHNYYRFLCEKFMPPTVYAVHRKIPDNNSSHSSTNCLRLINIK